MPARPARPLPAWLARDLPFDRRAIDLDDGRMTFVDHGEPGAVAVLMVHGNPTWSYLWRKVIGLLAGQPIRVVAPDLLGFGASDKLRRVDEHQLDRHIDDVADLVEELGLERIVLAGQDWGGPIACGVGERFSSRVQGLVLGNTSVLPPARPFRPKAFHRFSRLPVASDLAFRGLMFPVPVLSRVQGDRASIGVRETAAYAWPHRWPHQRAGGLGLARMVPNRERHPSVETLDRVGAWVGAYEGPAALVWGRRDPILGRGLRRHAAALPQASVRECDAGHFSQEEVPHLWAEAIREVIAAS